MRRRLLIALGVLVVIGVAGWYWQSQIIGYTAKWYLARQARAEDADGSIEKRRATLVKFNSLLLMPPPNDAYVPELYDLVTALSSRVATGEVSLNWAAYIYTTYQRDLERDRPTGQPRRSSDEVNAQLAKYIEFFSIQKRPDAKGITVGDVIGADGDDVITLDEIEQADKTGKDLDLRHRGAKDGEQEH
jgi:hypothetical protein